MRTQSLSVRVMLVGVLLTFVVAVCVAFLVVSGGVNPTGSRILGAGGALLLLAVLAAAVSALGPKYRPTPLLTPMAAGVFTALIATTIVFAGHSQFATNGKPATRGVAARHVPPVLQAQSKVAPEPVTQTAAVQPPPAAKPVRLLDAVAAPANAPAAQPVPQAVAAAPQSAAVPATKPPPAETSVAVVPEPAKDTGAAVAEGPVTPQQAPVLSAPAKKPVAVGTIPSPKAAPPPLPAAGPGAPMSLQAGFDTSTPAARSAGPPLALASAGALPVTPPLPRIRPCGAGGPACP